MKCIKCETEMTKALLLTNPAGAIVAVNKNKNILESPKVTQISCYVCSKCGYVELQADDPKNIL
ncbi:MAG: hypothetical protein MJ112_09275 [Lachnospiraceae bacterium]|nr:hypothetical protein [Lachnospiraceae bacterium]